MKIQLLIIAMLLTSCQTDSTNVQTRH